MVGHIPRGRIVDLRAERSVTLQLRTSWLLICLVLVLFASQALGVATAPDVPTTGTGEVLGHAGFAYIGIFRTYAAAVLWNRLEPVFHGYYSGVPLKDQKFMIPTVFMVQALDPQLEQPYYLGAYTLADMGDFKDALALAKRGVKENPRSGLLRANLAQILLMQDPVKNLPEMKRQADAGLSPDMTWTTPDDFYEGLAIFRTVYRRAGDTATVNRIQAAMDELSAKIDLGDHDHDGDGVPDH